jgi:prepilin-type N-terminal cleavage/methylation domain-containing protein
MKVVRGNRGFTLVELMVVLVIVGLLAAFAIPRFSKAVYKTKASEFPTILMAIYNAEKSAFDETGVYEPLDQLDLDAQSVQDSKLFTYAVNSENWEEGFVASATVKTPGFGKASAGKQATIDQTGAKSGDPELTAYVKTWR